QIEDMMQPFRAQRDLLTTIPGIGPFVAAAVISEAGADIAETFPSADQFASGSGCVRATTNPPANAIPANPARATSTCSTSSSNAHGPRHAHLGICKVTTAGMSASSAAHATRPPRTKPSSPSRTNWPSSSGTCWPPANPMPTSVPTTSTAESTPRQKPADSSPDSRPSATPSPSNPQPKTTQRSNPASPDGFALPGHPRFTYQPPKRSAPCTDGYRSKSSVRTPLLAGGSRSADRSLDVHADHVAPGQPLRLAA